MAGPGRRFTIFPPPMTRSINESDSSRVGRLESGNQGLTNGDKILDLMQKLHERSMNMESIISARAASLVMEQLAATNFEEFYTRAIMQELQTQVTALTQRLERIADRYCAAPVTVTADIQPPRYRTFFWGGDHHFFPKNFKLPVISSVALWRLWLFGDDNAVDTPYRRLDGKHMSKSQRTQLSKARGVMDHVRNSIGKTYAELTAEGLVEAESQFSDHYLILMRGFKSHATMSFSTAYKHLRAASSNATDDTEDSDTNV